MLTSCYNHRGNFPGSQTSRPTANRRRFVKNSLRVKITPFLINPTFTCTVFFSSIQVPLTRNIGSSYYFINPSYSETRVIFIRAMSFWLGSATPKVRHSKGLPPPGSATPRIRHSQLHSYIGIGSEQFSPTKAYRERGKFC